MAYEPTYKDISDRITEMRGATKGIVVRTLVDTVFGESEEVYMAKEDASQFRDSEFVFVIPTNVSSHNSMIARGWWAETVYFENPIED